jgi:hypothetical protein
VDFNTFWNFSVFLRQTPARLAAGLEAKNLPRFLTLSPDKLFGSPASNFYSGFGALNCVSSLANRMRVWQHFFQILCNILLPLDKTRALTPQFF